MEVTLDHVAVGGNAISNALSSNRAIPNSFVKDSSLICAAFGAKNGVALVTRDQQTPSLLQVQDVLQHGGATTEATRITSVYLFAPSIGDDQRVLAGDSEGNVMLWTKRNSQWELHNLVDETGEKIATDSVAAVAAVKTQQRWLYIASFSNGHLAVFEQPPGASPKCIRIKKLGVKMIMETIAATAWATGRLEDDVLIAAGGVDSKVYLFEVAGGTTEMMPLFSLEGHRGWIRAVDFERRVDESARCDALFLASASQDHRVRLWKITTVDRSDASDVSASATSAGYQSVGAISVYTLSFDSLLIAHEDWVTSVGWTLVDSGEVDAAPVSALVSTSMDNTVIVWKRNTSIGASSTWVQWLRVGDHGGNGILSSTLLPSTDAGLDLLAFNFSGHLERWLQEPAPSKMFQPAASLNGHTSPVTDISWSPRGDYLISLSLDQTTRVLAQWCENRSWHEISRAQVHGYDINCGAFIAGQSDDHNDRFVCGADEKILRIFEAPDDIQALVNSMNGAALPTGNAAEPDKQRIEHAYLPELSLTNKSADKVNDKTKKHVQQGSYTVLIDSLRLPVGETLSKKTLWPEQRKLYGHGNELLCVTSNHGGTLLASACKSREEKFAAIWVWNVGDWSAIAPPLDGHKSSVVQLAFSPDDQFLLSVSKDRQFCVFAKQENGTGYALVDRVKAHKRIIWSCSWAPRSFLFATGARDQTVAFWGKHETENKWTRRGEAITLDSAVTAVAFSPWTQDETQDKFVLAVGTESGRILFFKVDYSDKSTVTTSLAAEVPPALSPSTTVTRLAWMPSTVTASSSSHVLASCSADHSVRLYRLSV